MSGSDTPPPDVTSVEEVPEDTTERTPPGEQQPGEQQPVTSEDVGTVGSVLDIAAAAANPEPTATGVNPATDFAYPPPGSGVQASDTVGGISLGDIDLKDSIKRVGQQIMQTLTDAAKGVTLSESEAAIAARAAESIAASTILGVGADAATRNQLLLVAARAQATLLNLYVGEKIELRLKARDAVLSVLRIVFSEALNIFIGLPIIHR